MSYMKELDIDRQNAEREARTVTSITGKTFTIGGPRKTCSIKDAPTITVHSNAPVAGKPVISRRL